MKILLIEDQPLNIELFRAVLERDGHVVTHESSGLLGRTRALAEPFDLILSDIDLPGLDGHSICVPPGLGVRSWPSHRTPAPMRPPGERLRVLIST